MKTILYAATAAAIMTATSAFAELQYDAPVGMQLIMSGTQHTWRGIEGDRASFQVMTTTGKVTETCFIDYDCASGTYQKDGAGGFYPVDDAPFASMARGSFNDVCRG